MPEGGLVRKVYVQYLGYFLYEFWNVIIYLNIKTKIELFVYMLDFKGHSKFGQESWNTLYINIGPRPCIGPKCC